MKFKFNTTTVLLAATATVILLGVIVNQLQLASSQKVEIDDKFAFDKVTVDKVEKFEIIKQDETVVLTKTDGVWKVGEMEADDSTINSLITIVNESTADQLASTNSENHASFGVDDSNGVLVKFYKAGDNLIEQVIFGNYVAGGKIYGRKIDGNNVYAISANIYGMINQSASDWEKVVEAVETEDSLAE